MLTTNQVDRLRGAFESSVEAIEPFRQMRAKLVDAYAGPSYGKSGMEFDRNPVNLNELYVNIYMQRLAARRPQVLCDSPRTRHRALAADLESDINETMERMDFQRTCYTMALDSLFGLGIVCTGLEMIEDGYGGRLYCEPVDLDDWVHDMSARSWSPNEMQWCGHRVRMRYEDVMKSDLFKVSALNPIQKIEDPAHATDDDESVSRFQRRSASNIDLFAPLTELFIMWIPRENMIAVFPMTDGLISGKPIREAEWTGAPGGPYDTLMHVRIPSNSMPQAPLSYVYDLNELYNALVTKEGRNALQQKMVYPVPTGAEEDATKIIDAKDGEIVGINNPQALGGAVSYRGVNQLSLAFAMQIRQLFSYVGGNIDQIGGLASQAGTFGQEELLAQSASERVKAMQKNVIAAVRSIAKKIAYYRYTDPMFRVSTTRSVPGVAGVEIPVELSAESFEGVDWQDLNFDIEPYSMQDVSPPQQVASMMQIVQGVVLPLMPLLQAQGNGLDVEALLRRLAKLTNTKGLDDIITSFRAPAEAGEGGPSMGSHEATKAPITRREEVRRSVPRSGSQQQDSAMMSSLLGMNKQPAETARVGQPG